MQEYKARCKGIQPNVIGLPQAVASHLKEEDDDDEDDE